MKTPIQCTSAYCGETSTACRTCQYKQKHDEWYQSAFMEYVNNYLTVERFAEAYQVSKTIASAIIDKGRLIHDGVTQ